VTGLHRERKVEAVRLASFLDDRPIEALGSSSILSSSPEFDVANTTFAAPFTRVSKLRASNAASAFLAGSAAAVIRFAM
jgi:hypothetical protein